MELDLWTSDFPLAMEWDLENAGHFGGQLGDTTLTMTLDESINLPFQGTLFSDALGNEDALPSDWMETTDIAAFFNNLGDDERRSLECTLLEMGSTNNLDANISPVNFLKNEEVHLPLEVNLDVNTSPMDFLKNKEVHPLLEPQSDVLLSPPESPQQVAPTFELEVQLIDSNVVLKDENLGLSEIDLINFGQSDALASIIPYDSVYEESINSDCSHSLSSPSSPSDSQHSSIIQSSPELYKVISNNSNVSERFSPYPQVKSQDTIKKISPRAPRRTKNPAQPVPEQIIMAQNNKKDRKKLQNKNAAIRYRMKKKEEAEGIKSEESELEEINKTLKNKVDDLEREVKYMKNLMQDVFKAKGLNLDI